MLSGSSFGDDDDVDEDDEPEEDEEPEEEERERERGREWVCEPELEGIDHVRAISISNGVYAGNMWA